MKLRFLEKPTAMVVMFGLLFTSGAAAFTAQPAGAATTAAFADPAFQKVWSRTDALVQSEAVKRSWYWGPQPNTDAIMEDYAEGQGGKHLVQYFDKSRMEINNPVGDKNNPFYVTNGLLTVELITGKMQTGDNSFVQRWPAHIAVAGDSNQASAPTYASFRGAIERVDPSKLGQVVTATISWNGQLDFVHGVPPYANFDRHNIKNAYYEQATRHNIPDVFWQFLNQQDQVLVDGRRTTAALNVPYFYATGYPISDAYWTTVLIRGQSSPVLIQAFQRRVLTYVPSNPEGFKVEMGNVGLHYYDWRYKDAGQSDAVAGRCQTKPILGFGKLYSEKLEVRVQLGCAQSGESRYTMSRQSFERGEMIGITRFDFYSGRDYDEVFALYNDGTAASRSQLQPFTGPEPTSPTPPSGLYAPMGNLGTMWRADAIVHEKLGWATAPIETATYDKKAQSGGGVAQFFAGGLLAYPNLDARKIYVIYNNSGYAYEHQGPHVTSTVINRWSVYDDTFQQ